MTEGEAREGPEIKGKFHFMNSGPRDCPSTTSKNTYSTRNLTKQQGNVCRKPRNDFFDRMRLSMLASRTGIFA